MSFHWKEFNDVAIDSLITTILTELKTNGGWIETDPGYNVVTDPNSKFDLGITLEATTKRFLQFKIGEHGMWDTVTHAWISTYFEYGHLLADTAASHPAGTEEGIVKISFDDSYATIITDYTANGADFRRCCSFGGLTETVDSTDEALSFGSSLWRGTNPNPANTGAVIHRTKVMRDVSGSLVSHTYLPTFLVPDIAQAFLNGAPRLILLSATVDKRFFPYIYLSSNGTIGEAAGIRATIPSMFVGGAYDSEPHGSTIRTSDGKEYFYFQQDTTYIYYHFATRLLVRCK